MLAAIFPGQGSQSVGMSKFLYEEFQVAREVIEEASDSLSKDMKKLLFDGPESDLTLTENTQPAILTSSYVTFKSLTSLMPLEFKIGAGHSIGEYGAFVVSGAMTFTEAVKAVQIRGQEMQKAVPAGQGGMVALMGATPEQAQQACVWVKENNPSGGELSPANFNAPGQIVLSGHQAQVEFAAANVKADIFSEPPRRLKFIPLKVSAPFHCNLMKPAEERMASVLKEMQISPPKFAIVQNFDAKAHTDVPELRDNLVKQISGPVLWVDCVNELKSQGASQCIELGNGKVLSGLVKKIDADIKVWNINSLEDVKALEQELNS